MEWFLLFFLIMGFLLGLINLIVLLFIGRLMVQMVDATKESNEAIGEIIKQNKEVMRRAAGLMDIDR